MGVWLRRIGIGLGVVIGVVALVAAGAYVYGGSLGSRTLSAPTERRLTGTPDSALVARGEHLATAIGKCVECHGVDLGGTAFINEGPLGRIPAPNLTSGKGGALARYSDEALERVIRHGIKENANPAMIMPSEAYQYFTDADIAALIAYLRARPPVDREFPAPEVHFLGRALLTANQMKYPYDLVDHQRAHAPELAVKTDSAYGFYLANVGGCLVCHGPGLAGGASAGGGPPSPFPPSNLTRGGIGSWTEADFRRALREGIRPGGTAIDTVMPWKLAGKMTDQEISALWAYLRAIPAKEFGAK